VSDQLRALLSSEPGALADPHSVFGPLRERTPVAREEAFVLLTRYDDVKEALRDDGKQFSRGAVLTSRRQQERRALLSPEAQRDFDDVVAFELRQIVRTDGPEHERLRRSAHRAFTPRRIEELRGAIERYTDELLDRLAPDEVADFKEFASALPLQIIGDLLGIPQADRPLILQWTGAIGRNRGGGVDAANVQAAAAAIREFGAYVEGILREPRGPNAVSSLVRDLHELEGEELTAMFVLLLFAGSETSTNLIGNGLYELLRRRDQWELLCEEPERSADATEELMRFVSPSQWLQLVAVEDLEIAGEPVAAGETVLPLIASANRDPRVFADPDDLNIHREDARKQLGFGFGPHFCLGATLTRYEGATAFGRLARRFPDVELAADDFTWTGSAPIRTLRELPVRLGRERKV
jgi:cytochrome P450